jgi:hypothetical protein
MHKISPKVDKTIERPVEGGILGEFWTKDIKFIKQEYRIEGLDEHFPFNRKKICKIQHPQN